MRWLNGLQPAAGDQDSVAAATPAACTVHDCYHLDMLKEGESFVSDHCPIALQITTD